MSTHSTSRGPTHSLAGGAARKSVLKVRHKIIIDVICRRSLLCGNLGHKGSPLAELALPPEREYGELLFVFYVENVLPLFELVFETVFDEENKDTKLAITFIQLTSSPRNPRAKSFNVH